MKNFQEGIDNLVNKILSEEIDAKVKQIMENNVIISFSKGLSSSA